MVVFGSHSSLYFLLYLSNAALEVEPKWRNAQVVREMVFKALGACEHSRKFPIRRDEERELIAVFSQKLQGTVSV